MELTSYLQIIWRQRWIISATVSVALVITVIGTWLMTPKYEASAKLHMMTITRGSLDFVDYEIAYAERLMNTYVNIAASDDVREHLATVLLVNKRDVPELSASIVANTELLAVTAEGDDPELVQAAANGLAGYIVGQSRSLSGKTEIIRQETLESELAQLRTEIFDLEGQINSAMNDALAVQGQSGDAASGVSNPAANASVSAQASLRADLEAKRALLASLQEMDKQAQIREALLANTLSIISPAERPTSPSSPNPILNFLLGAVVGLVGGLGLAFLFEDFDMKAYAERLEEVVERNPYAFGYIQSDWNVQSLNEQMTKETGIRLSNIRLRQLLDDLGYKLPSTALVSKSNLLPQKLSAGNLKKVAVPTQYEQSAASPRDRQTRSVNVPVASSDPSLGGDPPPLTAADFSELEDPLQPISLWKNGRHRRQ